jgi:hypothetical protein
MKAFKVFENAKVVSVNNGEIWIEVNSGLQIYKKAALISVCNGNVKIEYDQPLTEDILQNGRIVENSHGERKLVLKRPDGHAILVGTNFWAQAPLCLSGEFRIVKVYEGGFMGNFGTMLNAVGELVWSE